MVDAVMTPEPESGEGAEIAVPQRTLGGVAIASGIGLHLAQQTTVKLLPAEPGRGRYFVRTDLVRTDSVRADAAEPVIIPATPGHVVKTQLSTELGAMPDAGAAQTVRTVEHLLAALVALDVDNVRIEIDGPELPLLDGSAKEWMAAIVPVGTQLQSAERKVRSPVTLPVTVHAEDAWVAAFPSPSLRFTYGIDFDLPAIGNQWHSWSPTADDMAHSFADEIASARTFGLAHQIDYLRSKGLIQGGSLDNALVCSHKGWVNPPLRFDNEPARHKMLDLIGDLGLMGCLPAAHYVAYKASHTLHVELAKKLADGTV
ncbi:MAG: UDP-3-O-acyl-N-acetylglucosamine deacetylase [Cyanobacteria bacterium P01_D01_bin.36]